MANLTAHVLNTMHNLTHRLEYVLLECYECIGVYATAVIKKATSIDIMRKDKKAKIIRQLMNILEREHWEHSHSEKKKEIRCHVFCERVKRSSWISQENKIGLKSMPACRDLEASIPVHADNSLRTTVNDNFRDFLSLQL